MEIKAHQINDIQIAEILSDQFVIQDKEDGIDLLGNLYYQGFDRLIIYEKNITSDFFDLQNGIAGEILQKFSNYRVKLVIVGDFSRYTRKSIKDFIYESNKGKLINFLPSLSDALKVLSS